MSEDDEVVAVSGLLTFGPFSGGKTTINQSMN